MSKPETSLAITRAEDFLNRLTPQPGQNFTPHEIVQVLTSDLNYAEYLIKGLLMLANDQQRIMKQLQIEVQKHQERDIFDGAKTYQGNP